MKALTGDYEITQYELEQMTAIVAKPYERVTPRIEMATAPKMREVIRQTGGAAGSITGNGKVIYVPPYTPGRVQMSQRKIMRMDPELSIALAARKAPVLMAFEQVQYKCEDPELAAFDFAALDPIIKEVVRTGQNALDFGFVAHEKVWEWRDVRYMVNGEKRIKKRALVYKQFKDIDPEYTQILTWAETGEFAGFMHQYQPDQVVDSENAYVVTHDKEFGGLHGRPILDVAYTPWYWWSIMSLFINRYFERKATPMTVAWAPVVRRQSSDTNAGRSAIQIMGDKLASLIGEGVCVLPAQYDDKGNLLWKVELLLDDQRGDMFLAYIRHLQDEKVRSVGVPERVLTQYGALGSFAMARSHTDTFVGMLTTDLTEQLTHINKYVLPQLTERNWGVGSPPVTIDTVIKLQDRKDLIIQLMSEIIAAQGKGYSVPIEEQIDTINALRTLGVPVKSPESGAVAGDEDPNYKREKIEGPASEKKEPTQEALALEQIAADQWREWQEILGQDGFLLDNVKRLPKEKEFQSAVYEMLKKVIGKGKKTSQIATEVLQERRQALRHLASQGKNGDQG